MILIRGLKEPVHASNSNTTLEEIPLFWISVACKDKKLNEEVSKLLYTMPGREEKVEGENSQSTEHKGIQSENTKCGKTSPVTEGQWAISKMENEISTRLRP